MPFFESALPDSSEYEQSRTQSTGFDMSQKLKLEWQIEFVEKISKMTLRELFDYFADDLSIPDDHDGEFTDRGEWMKDRAIYEIRKILSEIFV